MLFGKSLIDAVDYPDYINLAIDTIDSHNRRLQFIYLKFHQFFAYIQLESLGIVLIY